MNPVVELTRVSKTFGDIRAVSEASLSVARGDFLTVVGPSGCGKTTLLRMIAGFETPSSGEIRINGDRVDVVPPYRRSIGMVFQKLALFPHMTAAQNIAYPLKMRRFAPRVIPGLVKQYLELVQLGGLGDRRPHELSGGQQQRVAIARALVFSPDLLLLDEPLSALDRKLREEMQLEFRRIQRELAVTTINVTHDQREALVMSDQIVVMDQGVIQQAATPQALYRQPANRFVAHFLGVTTLLDGRVVRVGDDGDVAVQVGDTVLQARGVGQALVTGAPVDCAIRAERIGMAAHGQPGLDNTVDGVVLQRIFEGDRVVYVVRVPALGDAVLSLFDRDADVHETTTEGQSVRLAWQARDLMVFAKQT